MLVQRVLFAAQRTVHHSRYLSTSSHATRTSPTLVLPHRSRRHLTTPPPQVNVSELSTERYNLLSDATMDTLLDALEGLLDDLGRPEFEVEYHSGVLTLHLGDQGTYVINKQPPNKQIWLSSPFSGPKRYDYSALRDDWFYSRDGQGMGRLLEDELSRVFQRKVQLGLGDVSKQL